MANIGQTNTYLKITVSCKTGSDTTYTRSYEKNNSAGDNTEAYLNRLKLASGAAHDVDLGEFTSFDEIALVASEDMDNVYLDSAGTDQIIAKDAHFVMMSGLASETELRIDLTGASAAVTHDLLLISNE